jgi:glycosyltransferase involved in cell wall biosynthesis
VCLGLISPTKNQLELIEAAIRLKIEGKLKNKVIIIGHHADDKYWQQILSLVQLNDLQDTVEFIGYQAAPYKFVGPNDIFVQPSQMESVGRVMTEAMKLGLVCVGADIPGTREAFRLGGGTTYKSGDSSDLAKVLDRIINNPRKYRAQAAESRKKALINLSEPACHDPFFNELSKILGQPNPQRQSRHLASSVVGGTNTLESQGEQIQKLHAELVERDNKLKDIYDSKSWKIARSLQKTSARARFRKD